MGARVGLLRLDRAGLIEPPAWPLAGTVGDLAGLHLEAVADKSISRLGNGLIARWHYPGLSAAAGALLRDLIRYEAGLLGAPSVSAQRPLEGGRA
ncbi:hypothetical protein [Thioflavicoccus mobilis]|uniref:hypothetical protein n=1 Tax=Thioflavicoccus mobilis TaxID=80679 RepID=UPI0005A157D7|nr:hypothetical protein [Thioflavicoccus mobilis]